MTYTLKGFGPAAMQSWQQFTSAVNQGNTVIAQMRTDVALGAVSNKQYDATIRALAGQMAPFTQGNAAAVTMLDNLAKQAGGPTTNSLKALQQWAGVSGKAAQDQLAKGMEAATVAGGNLSAVARALASTLSTDLTCMMSQAAIKASGLQGALDALASAMRHGASQSTGFHGTLTPVIADLLKLHQDVPTITAEFQGMGIHISQAGVQALIASGHLGTLGNSAGRAAGQMNSAAGAARTLAYQIAQLHGKTIDVNTIYHTYGSPMSSGKLAAVSSHGAHGGIVTDTGIVRAASGAVLGGFAPGRDIIPALLSPGEAILNPHATRMLGTSTIHALNAMAERGGGMHPAALQMGGPATASSQPAVIENHNHIYLDGEQIYEAVKVENFKYGTRNAGDRTGLMIPGSKVG